ncbi:MAG: hypothetical protein Kow0074_14800 [Candidatus Zixiibacteriota bacterium]
MYTVSDRPPISTTASAIGKPVTESVTVPVMEIFDWANAADVIHNTDRRTAVAMARRDHAPAITWRFVRSIVTDPQTGIHVDDAIVGTEW